MPLNVYECMFLLDTNKVAGDLATAEAQLLSMVQKHHAEPLVYRPWDERRLAYPIAKHKKGLYYLMYVRTEGKNLAEIEKDISLNEMILRSMILKIDPKLVETMLSIAKGDHAPALHNIHDDPADDTKIDDGTGGGDRPRRRRNDDEGKD